MRGGAQAWGFCIFLIDAMGCLVSLPPHMKLRCTLALLLCFLLVQTQTYALSGGPDYGGSPQALVGTYSGVLIAEDIDTLGIDPLLADIRENALGLFTFGMPSSGLGTGQFLLFSEGIIFDIGEITIFGDPGDNRFQGILEAEAQIESSATVFVDSGTDGGTSSVATASIFHAAGQMEAKMDTAFSGSGLVNRIKGDAFLAIDQGTDPISGEIVLIQKLNFKVDGLRQTTAVDSSITGTLQEGSGS